MATLDRDASGAGAGAPEVAGVCVIGAGIVGLFNALQYARRGISVLLIDNLRGNKRSYKVGESLLVFGNHFLRTIGGLDDFLVRSFPKDGVWFAYGAEAAEDFEGASEFAFQTAAPPVWRETMRDGLQFRSVFSDAQIVRPEAEDAMVEQLRRSPLVRILDSARVRGVEVHDGDRPHEVRWECPGDGSAGVSLARWVIDCTGRRRLLARQFGHDIAAVHDDFRTTAVWGQFSGCTDALFDDRWRYHYADEGSTSRDRSTLHFWGEGYWMWLIRLTRDRVSVGVTFDQRRPPAGRSYEEQFWEVVGRYPLMRDKISPAAMLEMRTYRDVQYVSDTYVSPRRYAMAGDAASIIDAYYSQGISLALVTSWHAANIVERDLAGGGLDHAYIRRVNRATRQDWLMMRNMVRHKYSAAIKDGRYFVLTHVLDSVVFVGMGAARWRLVRWLVETAGDTRKERPEHRRMRRDLVRHLYLSQPHLWGFLAPEVVQRLQGRWQERMARRAIWRQENGVRLPATKAILRLRAPLPLAHRLLAGPKRSRPVELSARGIAEPAWVRPTGKESLPLPVLASALAYLAIFLGMYAYDWMDTSRRVLAHRLSRRRRRRAEPSATREGA